MVECCFASYAALAALGTADEIMKEAALGYLFLQKVSGQKGRPVKPKRNGLLAGENR